MRPRYYKYTFINREGKKIYQISSSDKKSKINEIEKDNGIVLDIKRNFKMKNKSNYKNLYDFSNKMAMLLEADVSLIDGLDYLICMEKNHRKKLDLTSIKKGLELGNRLSESMERVNSFPKFLMDLIILGEIDGNLAKAFKSAEDYYKNKYKLRKYMIKSLTYPLFLIIGLILTMGFMFRLVLPSFVELYSEFGGVLPDQTLWLLGINNFIASNYTSILLFCILFIVLALYLFRQEKFKLRLDEILLRKLKLLRIAKTVEINQIIYILLDSNLQLYKAFDIYVDIVDNFYIKKMLRRTVREIEKGKDFIKYLDGNNIYPELMISLWSLGYENGDLKNSMKKNYEFFKLEFENRIDLLISLIEPLILVIVGFFILIMIIGILLPMFNMIDLIV